MSQLKNKIAIITGVSRLKGIGAAICKELAEAGYHIFFTYWTDYEQKMPWSMEPSEPMILKEQLQKCGVKAEWMKLDLTAPNAPEQLFNKVTEILGYPDIIINNTAY